MTHHDVLVPWMELDPVTSYLADLDYISLAPERATQLCKHCNAGLKVCERPHTNEFSRLSNYVHYIEDEIVSCLASTVYTEVEACHARVRVMSRWP